MKILLVLNYGWEFGGGEAHAFMLQRALTTEGHEVRIFSSDNGASSHDFHADYTFKEATGWISKAILMLYNPRSAQALRRALSDFEPDIVHIHSLSNQVTASICGVLPDYPTIMTVHSLATFLLDPSTRGVLRAYEWLRALSRRLFIRNIRLFISPSRYLADALPAKIAPVKLLPNAIEPLPVSSLPEQNTLLFIGRLSTDKGIKVFLETLPLLPAELKKSLKVIIVGDGPEAATCKAMTAHMKEPKIQFVGRVARVEIASYYAQSSVVVVPSIVPECFPTTILEAMSVGRPVIASDIGGIPEMITDDKNGLLAPPNSPIRLAEAIGRVFCGLDTLERMSKETYAHSRQYSLASCIQKLLNVYDKATHTEFR